MGDFANNFNEAFDALQKGASSEPLDGAPEEDPIEEPSEEQPDQAPSVALKKGTDTDELVQYIDADEFLKAQIELLDGNSMVMENALNGNLQATALLVKGLVGLSEQVELLHEKLDAIGSQPASGARPAMSEAEAAAMQKSITEPQPHGDPPPAPAAPLNNAALAATANAELRKAFDAASEEDPAKLDLRNDLVLLESSASLMPVHEIVPRMSQKGRELLTSALRAPDAE